MNKLEALKKKQIQIENQIKDEENKIAISLGTLAIKAGLSDLKITDKELLYEMKKIRERFQEKTDQ